MIQQRLEFLVGALTGAVSIETWGLTGNKVLTPLKSPQSVKELLRVVCKRRSLQQGWESGPHLGLDSWF